MFAASLGALLTRSIDYAGMFPPCSLALEPALQNQTQYVHDPDAWMLNTFVLPVEKFDAAAGSVSLFDRKRPLLISALGAETAIALVAEHNSTTGAAQFGYKLRTGGVAADAFPASQQIARALVAAAKQRVPIKFTAGLHHPIRQFRDEVKTKMHGFLNVLGAAVLAAEHRWDAHQTSIMLEDENADSFSFTDDLFAWREWKIDIERLKYRRKFVTSFGSC